MSCHTECHSESGCYSLMCFYEKFKKELKLEICSLIIKFVQFSIMFTYFYFYKNIKIILVQFQTLSSIQLIEAQEIVFVLNKYICCSINFKKK
jgi:hypothetical protein